MLFVLLVAAPALAAQPRRAVVLDQTNLSFPPAST